MPPSSRITFEEFAILCHLANSEERLCTSQIAEYQGVLRPTMTHRTAHLARMGFIERASSPTDRRSVYCLLTEAGSRAVEEIIKTMCASIKVPMPLSRCDAPRLCRIIDAMGSVSLSASDLVLAALDLWERGEAGIEGLRLGERIQGREAEGGIKGLSVGDIVAALGLLQPTVSMALSTLIDQGSVQRVAAREARTSLVVLSESGRVRAHELLRIIDSIHVRNARRSR